MDGHKTVTAVERHKALPLNYMQACTLAGALALAMACGHSNTPAGPTVVDPPPVTTTVTFIGAGDIADCANDGGSHAEDTAKLLDAIPDATVFTAGDNAYPTGSTDEFNNCYHPRWGRHKGRTKPSPGNHEYETFSTAAPYYAYFGAVSQPGVGFYSYDLGAWHIVSLNSNVPSTPGSEQLVWLREDLNASRAKCTLAYFHHPRFTSGPSGGGVMLDVWKVLYEFKADVIVNGHDHFYELFGPQNPDGGADAANGIRQFTVGSGGAPLYDFVGGRKPNSAVQIKDYGILKLTLHPDSYDWSFIRAGSGGQGDFGTGACH